MYHDRISSLFYDDEATTYAEHCLIAVDGSGEPVARAATVPFSWPGDPGTDLPPGGYDAVILAAAADRLAGRRGDRLAGIEVAVAPHARGQGLSARMLDAVRANAARLGYRHVVVPVRPNGKHRYPDLSLPGYLARTRPDGLPEDPWLRVHVRAGGRIVSVAPYSMIIAGTLDRWREWTGLPFDRDGPVRVPGALVPVQCEVAADRAVYVEPNVWVYHAV